MSGTGVTGMTYAGTGVSYDKMDPFKRLAQSVASETSGNIARLNAGEFREFTPSRGESAYLIETPDGYLAHVEEGLGSKCLVADAMYALDPSRSYYDHIGQCTLAMIVNDLITLGALPLTAAMHLAVGDSDWFNDELRSKDLVMGWKTACDLARCTWGGGETPTLKDIIIPGTVVLSGSATGLIKPKERRIKGNIQHGDVIMLVESSGIHANGLTLARKIAAKLPDGYLTKLPNDRSFGETLLDPTYIYVDLVEVCLNQGVDIHYAVNITGHGWRKLMRAVQPFSYMIHSLPKQLPIFDFLRKHGPITVEESYGNLNNGAGFALYVPESCAERVIMTARCFGHSAFVAGHIERGDKKVVIRPAGIEFSGETLAVR